MKTSFDMQIKDTSVKKLEGYNVEEQGIQDETVVKKKGRPRLPPLAPNSTIANQAAKVLKRREQQREYQARKKLKTKTTNNEHNDADSHIDQECSKEKANFGIQTLSNPIIQNEDLPKSSRTKTRGCASIQTLSNPIIRNEDIPESPKTKKRGRPRLSAATLEGLPSNEINKILSRRKYYQEYRARKKLKQLAASEDCKIHKDGESHSMEAISNMASMEQNDRDAITVDVNTSICNAASQHWQKQIRIMQQDMKPEGHEPLKWTKKCSICQIDLLNSENMSFCCNNGHRLLPSLEPLPRTLEELYSIHEFSDNSRIINNLFCFTALGVEGDFMDLKMPSSVAIMGRTYHRLLSAGMPTSTLHWYVYDNSMRYTIAAKMHLPSTWIMQVATALNAINPYVRELKTIKELHPTPTRLMLADPSTSDEIAAIVHANNSITIKPRTAMIWTQHDHNPVFLSILDPTYEPLQYPLFFPHGTLGWHPHNDQKMSQIDWYRTRLLHEPRFSQLGRLCGEYLVDMYSRVEEERLNYIATEGYRRNLTQHEDDFIDDEDDNSRCKTLPASFLGSRQWCAVQVADALALARVKGRPSFFITITTNPTWPEIKHKLHPGQNASDNPTVVVRACHERVQHAKGIIRKYLGPISYMMHVIEFQKRGLPHGHIVVKTEHEIPIDMIDNLISAELPEDPALRTLVEKYMIHKHTKRCLKENNKCCYNYPKPLNPTTYIDEKGYVQYRRRTEADVDVVPHIPFLLREMDCHVYVDVASTVHIFAYLYGYIYKGFDTTRFHIERAKHAPSTSISNPPATTNTSDQNHTRNEIQDYISARYLSSMEATWRIMSYHMTEKHPSVKCLPLHLEGHNRSCFRSTSTDTGISLLDRYFLRPLAPKFDSITYIEYNEQYTATTYRPGIVLKPTDHLEQKIAGTTQNIIHERTRGQLICRIRLLLPKVGEPFYLRLILLHKAARSWDELKIHDEKQYETYQETAQAIGLIAPATEAITTMQEAISCLQTPSQLRFLFALLILDSGPALQLWETFQNHIIADFLQQYPENQSAAINESLLAINNILIQHGTNVEAFGLSTHSAPCREVQNELSKFPDHEEYLIKSSTMSETMNQNQTSVYTYICKLINNNSSPAPIFVYGKAGTGKTYVLNAICLYIRGLNQIILPCATTALASLQYPAGRTAHSLFQIPIIDNNIGIHSLLDPHSPRALLISTASAIIWDEFPMANRAVIEAVDILLQNITSIARPFGGKLLIAAGDFRQIAPVVKRGGKTATINASIISSHLWNHFEILELNEPVRNAADPDLVRFVDDIGEGRLLNNIPLTLFKTTTKIEDAISFLYNTYILLTPAICEKRAFLSPKNIPVDDFNIEIIRMISANHRSYFSVDRLTENDQTIEDHPMATTDFLNGYKHPALPQHELQLKPNTICHITKTLDKDRGLVKNARVMVCSMHAKFVTVKLLTGQPQHVGNIHPISRVDFFHQPDNWPWTIHRRQLPLRPAYSTTFHSCLGLTLDKIVLDLRTEVFTHGQLYTALTRVRRKEDVLILLDKSNTEKTTTNVVYKELLP